jgi:hypothetical protein
MKRVIKSTGSATAGDTLIAVNSIKDCGMLTIDEVEELTDEQLLALWKK